jgi:hypothetical protein
VSREGSLLNSSQNGKINLYVMFQYKSIIGITKIQIKKYNEILLNLIRNVSKIYKWGKKLINSLFEWH